MQPVRMINLTIKITTYVINRTVSANLYKHLTR